SATPLSNWPRSTSSVVEPLTHRLSNFDPGRRSTSRWKSRATYPPFLAPTPAPVESPSATYTIGPVFIASRVSAGFPIPFSPLHPPRIDKSMKPPKTVDNCNVLLMPQPFLLNPLTLCRRHLNVLKLPFEPKRAVRLP